MSDAIKNATTTLRVSENCARMADDAFRAHDDQMCCLGEDFRVPSRQSVKDSFAKLAAELDHYHTEVGKYAAMQDVTIPSPPAVVSMFTAVAETEGGGGGK